MVPIEIILFEANKNLRQSLTHLLGSSGVFAVTGSYGNCSDAFYIAKNFKPHAVLLDIDMPGESAIKGVMKVKEANPNTYIIIYAVFEDGDRLFKCLCAGACGYLLKKNTPQK